LSRPADWPQAKKERKPMNREKRSRIMSWLFVLAILIAIIIFCGAQVRTMLNNLFHTNF
jgi:hypothetical protein